MTRLQCTACGYTIARGAQSFRLRHCPRCLAKRNTTVPLRETEEQDAAASSPPAGRFSRSRSEDIR